MNASNHSGETLRIATRKSPLALWQAEHVAARLTAAWEGLQVELVRMTTQGDRVLDSPLARIGGKGLFVKELEVGLLEGRADLAVHSMKDVPARLPDGLHLPVVLPREDPLDAFVSGKYTEFDQLPNGARVGTASLRRQCQLLARRPDLVIESIRGNVGTRLGHLDEGNFDAIILAAAGLKRLGLESRITSRLPTEISLPAIGQGVIGIECRQGDARVAEFLAPLNDPETLIRVTAERAMNERLEGGCQVPLAGFAELEQGVLNMRGLVGMPDGSRMIRGRISGAPEEAARLGVALAEDLLGQGADTILRALFEAEQADQQ